MEVPLQPSRGDVIIHRSPASYTVAMSPFPPSVRCRTFDEALECAGAYASQQDVDVWWTSDGGTFVRMANYRLMRRIWAEFMEMPGLTLTEAQAQRLWALDARTCADLLASLVGLEFLTYGSDGRYRRLTEGRDSRTPARMAKAEQHLEPDDNPFRHPARKPA